MIKVEISLFGIFRKFDNGEPLIMEVPQGSNLFKVRQSLRVELMKRYPDFNYQILIDESALANEYEILPIDYRLEKDLKLAILPPVCGG